MQGVIPFRYGVLKLKQSPILRLRFVLYLCLALPILTSCFGETHRSFSFIIQNDSDALISVESFSSRDSDIVSKVTEIPPSESKEVSEYGFIVGGLAKSDCGVIGDTGTLPIHRKIIINKTFEVPRDSNTWTLASCTSALQLSRYIYK